jgi:hypothetical protein
MAHSTKIERHGNKTRLAIVVQHTISVLILVSSMGCWKAPIAIVKVAPADIGTRIEGLSSCQTEERDLVHLDPTRPLTVFVHGCNFSLGGFRTLARVFEAHGQQTVCCRQRTSRAWTRSQSGPHRDCRRAGDPAYQAARATAGRRSLGAGTRGKSCENCSTHKATLCSSVTRS